MLTMRSWRAVVMLAALMMLSPVLARAESVTLTASDGVKVFGEITRPASANGAVILAFHMAGSNYAEYSPIAPRLAAAGFTVLAIDQRSGGSQFGARNRTVDVLGGSTPYGQALKDMEAALDWAGREAKGKPVIVWGSSYSAALVFLLVAAHPREIAGLLAFSPDEYLGGGNPVHAAARKLAIPVLISQADDRDEIDAGRSLLTSVGSHDKVQVVPATGGVHGSSSLRQDANPRGAAAYWTAVLSFLDKFK